jgi:hypothetical protein
MCQLAAKLPTENQSSPRNFSGYLGRADQIFPRLLITSWNKSVKQTDKVSTRMAFDLKQDEN